MEISVADMLDRFQNLNVGDLIQSTLEELKPELAQQNREQMLKGKTATGNDIVPPYSPRTRKRKGFSTPNLKETGAFQQGIYADIRKKVISFDSTDIKTKKLYARYGQSGAGNIFGLGPEATSNIIDLAGPIFFEKVIDKLNL